MGSYHEIADKLPPMRARAYTIVCAFGPATAAELVQRANLRSEGGRGLSGNMSARLGELVENGVVEVLEERHCSVTGNLAYVYDAIRNPTYKHVKKPKVGKTLLAKLNRLKTKYPEHAEAVQTVARLLQEG